jgi:hypothetical protein
MTLAALQGMCAELASDRRHPLHIQRTSGFLQKVEWWAAVRDRGCVSAGVRGIFAPALTSGLNFSVYRPRFPFLIFVSLRN